MILYHGSKNIIEKPIYGYGKKTNDYGLGFYMTKDINLAKEWASSNTDEKGYVNKYELDIKKLKILDLDNIENKTITWITLLVKNREFNLKTQIGIDGKKYLIKNYLIDIDNYDLIKGYRADDCYYMYARTFLNNQLTIEKLNIALSLGSLGTQYVLKTKKAFENIKFLGYEEIDNNKYYIKRLLRNRDAAIEYDDLTKEKDQYGTYLIDIIRGAKYDK